MDHLVSSLFHLPRVVDDTRFCRLVDAIVHSIQSDSDALRLFALIDTHQPNSLLLQVDVRIAAAVIRLVADIAVHLNRFLSVLPTAVRAALDAIVVARVDAVQALDANLLDAALQLLAVAASFDALAVVVADARLALALAANCFSVDSLFVERAVCRLLAHLASHTHLAVHVRPIVLGDTHVCLQVLLEALRVAPTVPEARRARSLALIANDLLPNALAAISHAERLVQVAALDCVALAAQCSPPIVDVAAVCAKIAAFVASGDSRSAVFAFRLIAALLVPIDDADNVARLLALFDNALECSAAGFERFFSGDASAVDWRVPLLAALKTAQHLVARHGRFDSERMFTWLLPQCIALRSPAAGDASGGIVLAALTLLAAFGRCANSGMLVPSAEIGLFAALQAATASEDMRQASLMQLLDAVVHSMTVQPAFATLDHRVAVHSVTVVHALFASTLWERRDTAVDAAVRLVRLNRAFEAQLVPPVVSALSDEQPYVRASALAGLALLYREDHAPPSEALLRGIGALGDTEAVVRRAACSWLDVLLTHDDVAVRDAALARSRQTRASFDRLVVDADWEVKRQLIVVLSSVLRVHSSDVVREFGCVPQLLALVEDSARLVRLDAAIALATVKSNKVLAGGHEAAFLALDLDALIAINSELEPWNTDFDGIEVSEQRPHSNANGGHRHVHHDCDDDNDADDDDDDVPLDCE